MREMQLRAFQANEKKYILLKAPPASGKSRALMYIGLEKLINQNIKKIIVAVPERAIGASFSNVNLKETGFHSDWNVDTQYDLCVPGGVERKVDAFCEFMKSTKSILVCTHATLRFAFSKIDINEFKNCFIGIDEFHHVSASPENKLGNLIKDLIANKSTHILAMTGSYFRGDTLPVLMPKDEEKFFKVTYNYYEQLNGYKFLKSLGIGYHFYNGKYTSSITEVLNTDKKTIIHIPSPNSGESTKDKYKEVDTIIDLIGKVESIDRENNIMHVKRKDGKIIKIADLVEDTIVNREKTLSYLRNISKPEDIDIIIALGMAIEGFDWPYCETALTVGYRGSLTQIIQIIGRCTRDSENKTHAQFINLIAEPDVENDNIVESVNNMLKAITSSLLMEQVLVPRIDFVGEDESNFGLNTLIIKGFKKSNSSRVANIINSDLTDLKASVLQNSEILKAIPGTVETSVINKVLIPKVVKQSYPHLNSEEIEDISKFIVIDTVLNNAKVEVKNNNKFVKLADSFINVEDLNIDLINSTNVFGNIFEVMSKSFTPRVLKAVQNCILAFKIQMTDDEALLLWPQINEFVRKIKRKPNIEAIDPKEKRLAEALLYLKNLKNQDLSDG